MVRATTRPPCFSLMRTASSNAYSSAPFNLKFSDSLRMSFPSGAIWNWRSGFGICLRHTTTLRATATARRNGRYFKVPQSTGRGRRPGANRVAERRPRGTIARSGEDAPPLVRLGNPVDRDHVGGLAHVGLLCFAHLPDPVERAHHDALEFLVDLGLRPEELGEVLDPLEIRHGDAPAVREDVRDPDDPALVEDVVRLRRRWPVRALRDDLRLHARSVLRRQNALEGARRENVDFEFENLLVRDLLRPRESDYAPGLLLEYEDFLGVEPFLAEDASFRIRHGDDLRPLFVVHEAGEVHADIPEPLDRDGRSFEGQLDLLGGLADRIHEAAGRRLVPAERSSDHQRLARDHARDGEAFRHRDRVHDPGHRLAVRVHVRRGDVLLRADDDRDLGRIPAGHALELVLRHLLRIADHAALRAAVWDAHDRALPRHPAGEGADLVEGDVPVVPDPALEGADRVVVLDAVPREDLHGPVVQLDREVHGELTARVLQDLEQPGFQVQFLAGPVDLRFRDLERI